MKNIDFDDIEIINEWVCPYCKKENRECMDGFFEGDTLICSFCNKKVKVKEHC